MRTGSSRLGVAGLVAAAVLVVALTAVPIAPGWTAVGDASAASQDGDQHPVRTVRDDPEADNTVTRIEVGADGSARWSVTVRTRLRNESDVEDYEAFQERFRDNRTEYRERFARRMSGVVSNAANATGRTMTAEDVRVETTVQEVPRRWGVVVYSFTWTNFAAADGDALVVGDVFQGGLYLDEGDQLRVVSPSGYDAVSTSPPADEVEGTTRTWFGPHSFADQRPTVRYEPTAGEGTSTASESGTEAGPRNPGATGSGDGGWRSPLAAVTLLALVGAGLYAARTRSRTPSPLAGSTTEPNETDDDAPAEAGTTAESPDPPPAESELATDEDRVRALLERNGGRMRQADVADELEWSASKTSRVLSDMAEEGSVEKLRIGRENVIDLLED